MRFRAVITACICFALALGAAGAGWTLAREVGGSPLGRGPLGGGPPAGTGMSKGAPGQTGAAPGPSQPQGAGAQPTAQPDAAPVPWVATPPKGVTRTPSPRVAVINYHHLDPDPKDPYTITPARLEHDLRWFLDSGWTPLSLQQFRDWMEGHLTLVRDAFLLTFDDGYQSFAQHALPVLERLGVPATAFLITDDLGPTDPGMGAPKLLPSEIVSLLRSSLVTFGSHTHNLHFEVASQEGLMPAIYAATQAEVEADLHASVRRLEQLGITPIALAWPYGKAPDEAVMTAATQFPLIFTGDEGFVIRGQGHAIRRFPMEFRTPENLESVFGGAPK